MSFDTLRYSGWTDCLKQIGGEAMPQGMGPDELRTPAFGAAARMAFRNTDSWTW
jgi:hypothetical protein